MANNDPVGDALDLAKAAGEFNFDAELKITEWDSPSDVLTPERELKIIEAARAGHFRADQATAGGINPRTLRKWLSKAAKGDQRYTELEQKIKAAEFEAKDRLMVRVKKGSLSDTRAAQWLLEVRFKAQFAQRIKVIHATIKQERELMLDVVAEVLDEFEQKTLAGELMPEGLFDAFATRYDARLSEAQEASEEALEADIDE
jgi:hypothetical protein